MNKSKILFIFLSSISFGLLLAISVMAWTSPSANPPTGSGAIYYSGGNVGIGTSTPSYSFDVAGTMRISSTTLFSGNVGIGTTTVSNAKLTVDGTISASSPVNNGDVATKAWVTANAASTAYITTLIGNDGANQASCGWFPDAWCPSGWTIVTSWTYCTTRDVNSTKYNAFRQTLCSK